MVAVIGATGCGKTWWVSRYVVSRPRVIVLTAGFEKQEYATAARVTSLLELVDYTTERRAGWFQVQYPAPAEEFELVCRLAAELGACTLVLEEGHRYLPKHLPIAQSRPMFARLVAEGRHFGEREGVSLVVMTRWPSELPIEFRADCDRFVIFQVSEPEYVKWLAAKIGREDADRAALLPCGELGKCEGLEWLAGTPGARAFVMRPAGITYEGESVPA